MLKSAGPRQRGSFPGPRGIHAQALKQLAHSLRHPLAASGGAPDAETPRASRPRLGGISFLHRFSSAVNHHVHLHACVTDGVFVPAAAAVDMLARENTGFSVGASVQIPLLHP